jgi:hypothetical protein
MKVLNVKVELHYEVIVAGHPHVHLNVLKDGLQRGFDRWFLTNGQEAHLMILDQSVPQRQLVLLHWRPTDYIYEGLIDRIQASNSPVDEDYLKIVYRDLHPKAVELLEKFQQETSKDKFKRK